MHRSIKIRHYRNIGIMAHIDAGKTTMTERVLYYTGKLYKIGEVHNGNTIMDWMIQEKERGITITSAATTCFWKSRRKINHQINIIDTPGHVDFTIEVERSLRILDGAIAVFDAVAGVESQSETVWRQADKYHIPRICFINKMDRVGANFHFCIDMIMGKFETKILIMQLPVTVQNKFIGIIDLVINCMFIWQVNSLGCDYQCEKIPNLLEQYTKKYRMLLIESILEANEFSISKYLSCYHFSYDEINDNIRSGVINSTFVPIFCGSAFRNKAIQPLLDAIINYLPNPLDIPFRNSQSNKKKTPYNRADPDKSSFCALAFKIMNDPFVGSITFIRIYSGVLKSGEIIYNTRKKKKERVSRILLMHANHRKDINICFSGDIVAIAGLKHTFTGDTLSEIGQNIILEKIYSPDPVIVVAIEPKTKQDQEKMLIAVNRLIAEDPSLRIIPDKDSNQIRLGGMGELHLEVVLDRMKREFLINANIGPPQVAYKETIESSYIVDYTHRKQSGGAGQFARVKILFKNLDIGAGYCFESKIVGGRIPKDYIPAINKAILQASKHGVIAGYPLVDFKAILLDGSYHNVDSNILAFETASRNAFKKGVKNASPILLEPFMHVEIFSPKEYIGEIIGHLSSIRGKISEIESETKIKTIQGTAPLRNMFGYVNTLRSIAQGRAQYNMKFAYYAKVPNNVLNSIII